MVADPTTNRGSVIPEVARQQMTARLSGLEGLRVPGHMQRQQAPPSPDQLQAYLEELLCRDPAVFLERYALLLQSPELSAFAPLRHDYEINYWCQYAEHTSAASTSQDAPPVTSSDQQQRLPTTTKNRRLAYMNRLEANSEFFSEENMRERAPLLWHEYIGQHEGGNPADAPPPAARPGDPFHEVLLRGFDEAQLRARLVAGLEEEDCQYSEPEESSEELDSDQEQQQQQQQQPQQQQQEKDEEVAAAAAGGGPPQPGSSSSQKVPGAEQHVLKHTQPGAAAATAADQCEDDQEMTEAASLPNDTNPQQQQQQHPQQHAHPRHHHQQHCGHSPQQQQQPSTTSSGRQHPPEHQQQQQQPSSSSRQQSCAQAAAQRRQDFLEEMRSRFLTGGDGEAVDYGAIDADVGLDDDWLEQQGQDAQEAYFDAD